MQPTIRFGTDGWRGIIADDCTTSTMRRIARAYAIVLHELVHGRAPRVVVAYDRRFASDLFAQAVELSLRETGVDVLACREPLPTPVASFAVRTYEADGALVITASHNPFRYNGVKVKSRAGASAPPELYRRIEAHLLDAETIAIDRPGTAVDLAPLDDYCAALAQRLPLDAIRSAGFTVIADAMFGTTAGLLPRVLNGDLTTCIELNTTHNPLFPGIVAPEPIERNLAKLKRAVVDGKATIGVAFDGDGDRIGVVDEQGNVVSPQYVFALLAYYLLEVRGIRGPIVRSVNGTAMLDRLAELYGISVIETPNGFPYLAHAMLEHNAILAGEESGGFAVALHMPERDGLFCALVLLDFLRESQLPLSHLLRELSHLVGTWYYQRHDVLVSNEQRLRLAQALQTSEHPQQLAGVSVTGVSLLDGVKFLLSNGGWVLVRLSGTEPLVRIYAEMPDPGQADDAIRAAQRWLALTIGE